MYRSARGDNSRFVRGDNSISPVQNKYHWNMILNYESRLTVNNQYSNWKVMEMNVILYILMFYLIVFKGIYILHKLVVQTRILIVKLLQLFF